MGSSGAALAKRVIEERSLVASVSPRISAARLIGR